MEATVLTVLESASHNFDTSDQVIYEAELWMSGSFIFGFINGKEVARTTLPDFTSSHGFSLNVPEINEGDAATFNEVRVRELTAFASPSLDTSDLTVLFRVMMKEEIEEPTVRSWETYKRAKLLWERHRNLGRSDHTWGLQGYPIKKPTTEQWFV